MLWLILKQTKNVSKKRLWESERGSRGLTLLETLVVMGLLGVLASILFPVFSSVRESARGASCLSHEHQIGLALTLYCQDYDGLLVLYAWFPNHDGWWFDELQPYLKNQEVLGCPSTPKAPMPQGLGYSVNFLNVVRYGAGWSWNLPETTGPVAESYFAQPAGTLVLADGTTGALYDPHFGLGVDPGFAHRHHEGMDALFLDGHARRLREVSESMWGH